MKRRKEYNKMDAKDAIIMLSNVVAENHKECMRTFAHQNRERRKMVMAIVACAAYIYTVERRRRNMQDAIDILTKEIKELKATKGE